MGGLRAHQRFHTRPRVNSKPSIVICEPHDALRWPDASASQRCRRYSEGASEGGFDEGNKGSEVS